MVFGGSARQRGKSTSEADLLEAALNRGRRVLVCKRSGDLLYQRHGHLTSITPMRDEPVDLWQDECATFERFHADTPDNDLPDAATIAACKRFLDEHTPDVFLPADDDPPPRAA